MKYVLLFALMIFAVVAPAISQFEVPPVSASDDSLPVLGSIMIDPSNHPATFSIGGFFDIFTEVSLDFSGSPRSPLPPPGGSSTSSLVGTAHFHLSLDGGATFQVHTCPVDASMMVRSTGSSGNTQTFDTEMLQLTLSGGTLPAGVMIRESPTLPSTGRLMKAKEKANQSRMSSFFDVFTEISLDGGATWTPAQNSIRLETKVLHSPVTIPVESVIPQGVSVADLDGDGIPDLRLTNNTAPSPPAPPVGVTETYPLNARALVLFGGLDRAPSDVACVIRATGVFSDGTTRSCNTEMLQLDISGGTLPTGTMIRESPSKASLGRTSLRSIGGGQFQISSFFDIFTELSLDGGQTWTPREPATLEFTDTIPSGSNPSSACASVATYPNDLYPPEGMVCSKPPTPNLYANGMQVQNLMLRSLNSPSSLPLLGDTQIRSLDEDCDMQVSDGSGTGFQDLHATGTASVRLFHSTDNGDQRVFETEMLGLNLLGNSGGAVVMLRESPSKASLGRLTIEPNGSGFRISSFFDIFTEISLDGGQTWSPSAESTHVEQVQFPPLRTFETTNFPPPGVYGMTPSCAEIMFANGARLRDGSFFDISSSVPLPSPGGSSTNPATGRCRLSVSLDGGNSFFDVFTEVSMSLQVISGDSTPTTRFFDAEMLSLSTAGGGGGGGGTVMLRESPTLKSKGQTTLRESPTLPSRGNSFFDVFTELSIDGGQTWSPALTPMRVEFDSVSNGSISGMKWHDVNGNGVVDAGETGLSNWKIVLADTLGNLIDTTRTNAAGNYIFPSVPSGTYRVYEELPTSWIQTGGAPAYGFMTAPGQNVTGIDFGNFHSPNLIGHKFNDRNNNGSRDNGEEGLKDWEVCLSPLNNPQSDIALSTGTGTFSMRLNGLPPGVPVTGTLSGFLSKKGYDYYQSRSELKTHFENGDIPTEMVSLDMHGSGQSSGSFFDITYRIRPKGWDGTIKGYTKFVGGRLVRESFFDVFLECVIRPRDAASGLPTGKQLHCPIVLSGDLDGAGAPDGFAPGTVYRSRTGNIILLDDQGMEAGTLDSIAFTVGTPASLANPVCTITDQDGMYSFSPLLPGSWLAREHSQSGWTQTTPQPQPIVVTSGITVPPVDFGNFLLSDTLKYRTFSSDDWVAAAQKKAIKKPKPGKPGTGVPNLVNAMDELFKKLGKAQTQLHVGIPGLFYADKKTERASIFPGSSKDVFATFWSKRAEHSDSSFRGLDFYNGGTKLITKRLKNLPASKQNNDCVEDMMGLACNIALSDYGLAQEGFGDLIYHNPGNSLHGMTVRQIKDYGDQLMTVWEFRLLADFKNLSDVASSINNAFSCGPPTFDCETEIPLDTAWWMGHDFMRIKGRYAVVDVPFLRANPGAAPRIIPTTSPAAQVPLEYELFQNYPNPFNPTTTITFNLGASSLVTLKIYNVLGQEVATLINRESMEEGNQQVEFDARNIVSGVYFYRLVAESNGTNEEGDALSPHTFTQVKKMMLLK